MAAPGSIPEHAVIAEFEGTSMWEHLLTALGLLLVLEGILPFLSPYRLRQALLELARLPDRVLRGFGLGSMLAGLLILYLLRL